MHLTCILKATRPSYSWLVAALIQFFPLRQWMKDTRTAKFVWLGGRRWQILCPKKHRLGKKLPKNMRPWWYHDRDLKLSIKGSEEPLRFYSEALLIVTRSIVWGAKTQLGVLWVWQSQLARICQTSWTSCIRCIHSCWVLLDVKTWNCSPVPLRLCFLWFAWDWSDSWRRWCRWSVFRSCCIPPDRHRIWCTGLDLYRGLYLFLQNCLIKWFVQTLDTSCFEYR